MKGCVLLVARLAKYIYCFIVQSFGLWVAVLPIRLVVLDVEAATTEITILKASIEEEKLKRAQGKFLYICVSLL